MPWIYELSLEAYREMRIRPSSTNGQLAVRRLLRATDFSRRTPFLEMGDKETTFHVLNALRDHAEMLSFSFSREQEMREQSLQDWRIRDSRAAREMSKSKQDPAGPA